MSRSLAAPDSRSVAETVSRLLGGFTSIRDAADNARALLASYVMMVEKFPIWAIEEGFERWATTTRENGLAFPPSAVELREFCKDATGRFERERVKLLQATKGIVQPISPAEHARVSAGFDAIRSELRASSQIKREPTPAEARDALERRCAELGIDPIKAIDVDTPDRKPVGKPIGDLADAAIRRLAETGKDAR